MFTLKPLHQGAIPGALAKAERYRLLNEPAQAESICLDILELQPDNQPALAMLLLAMSDQFETRPAVSEARALLERFREEYDRAYYAGIICERRARALFHQGGMGSGFAVYDWLREAMGWYEKAEAIRPPGNDDALLRWNTCARFLMRNPQLEPAPQERMETLFLE